MSDGRFVNRPYGNMMELPSHPTSSGALRQYFVLPAGRAFLCCYCLLSLAPRERWHGESRDGEGESAPTEKDWNCRHPVGDDVLGVPPCSALMPGAASGRGELCSPAGVQRTPPRNLRDSALFLLKQAIAKIYSYNIFTMA